MQDLKKKTAEAIVNIFETGRILGNYGAVTLIPGDKGHLTYGRSQTTLASGNLFLLIKAYCEAANAHFADELGPYLERLKHIDLTLDQDVSLRRLLREAGDDIVMQEEQDAFFDRAYWQPAQKESNRLGLSAALCQAVVYDGHVHGSFGRMRDRANATVGASSPDNQRKWIASYVQVRRDWLAAAGQPLSNTVYRMDTFRELIDAGNWQLELPIRVRGHEITEAALLRPVRSSADDETTRLLRLTNPQQEGSDVAALQAALKERGFSPGSGGRFSLETDAAVRAFQEGEQLRVDGVVGPATRAALGLS